VLFLFPTLLPIDRDYVTLLGFAAIVSGAVMLVWRLRTGDDDEFDDGAVSRSARASGRPAGSTRDRVVA